MERVGLVAFGFNLGATRITETALMGLVSQDFPLMVKWSLYCLAVTG
jgi:hypothetical protein